MKALRCLTWGPPEGLVLEDLPDLVPGPGQAVVEVHAAAVNYPDVLIAANKYQVSIPTPFTPGSEFAGIVSVVGEGVTEVAAGDAVIGGGIVGCFAEQVLATASMLTKVPAGMDMADAAAYRVTYATSYHALRSVAEVQPGDWVVVLGAAGGVGMAAIDIALALGAKVLAAASSDEKVQACLDRGAQAGVNYDTESLKDRIKELTGGGADVVIDPVGGRYAEEALRACRFGARFVVVGFATGEIPRIPLNLVLLKGAIIKGVEMRGFSEHRPDDRARDERELMDLVVGGMRPLISATYSLDDAAQALRDMADRKVTGKVVIRVR